MLGMVLEVGVEAVAPRGADDVEHPRQLVVEQREHLRHEPGFHERGTRCFGCELLEDEEVPLLVVLLPPACPHTVEDTPGKARLAGSVGHRDVGDVLPCLVRHPGDELQDAELLKRPRLPVEQVHDREQRPGAERVVPSGQGRRSALLLDEAVVGQAFHGTERRPLGERGGDGTCSGHRYLLDVPRPYPEAGSGSLDGEAGGAVG